MREPETLRNMSGRRNRSCTDLFLQRGRTPQRKRWLRRLPWWEMRWQLRGEDTPKPVIPNAPILAGRTRMNIPGIIDALRDVTICRREASLPNNRSTLPVYPRLTMIRRLNVFEGAALTWEQLTSCHRIDLVASPYNFRQEKKHGKYNSQTWKIQFTIDVELVNSPSWASTQGHGEKRSEFHSSTVKSSCYRQSGKIAGTEP